MESMSSQTLLEHYTVLVGLYEKLEEISQEVFHALQSGSRVGELAIRLKENAVVAERISEESHAIADMKKALADRNLFSEKDRLRVRESEERLAQVVNRVVEQETKSRDLMMKQGVKISRK